MRTTIPKPDRDVNGRFTAGNPGRPLGSRNRMTNRLAVALLDDFTDNEAENIYKLRRWFFPQYVQLMGRFLPRETSRCRPDFADYAPAETARVVAAARETLAAIERGEAGLDDLLAALERDPALDAAEAETPDARQSPSATVKYGESTVSEARVSDDALGK